MVVVGLAETEAPTVVSNPVSGDQVKLVAPFAVKVVPDPKQMVLFEVLIVGAGITVTLVTILPLQPRLVPVIV